MLSIVIPFRNEDMLSFTVHRLQATLKIPHEIIVVDDGSDKRVEIPAGVKHIRLSPSKGVDVARHTGIEAARYDAILVIDAHMNFWDNDYAIRLVESVGNNPRQVACTVSLELAPDRMEMAEATGRYYGAHIQARDVHTTPGLHPAMRQRILEAKWNKTAQTGRVGCILGGAYLLNKNWYLVKLRSPWRNLRGWGTSEPVISIINYLMGGENICLDIEIGHMYRTGQYGKVPYSTYVHNVLFNQLFLAHVVIPEEHERQDLIAHLGLGADGIAQTAWNLLNQSDYLTYRRYLVEQGSRSWADYKADWMGTELTL